MERTVQEGRDILEVAQGMLNETLNRNKEICVDASLFQAISLVLLDIAISYRENLENLKRYNENKKVH